MQNLATVVFLIDLKYLVVKVLLIAAIFLLLMQKFEAFFAKREYLGRWFYSPKAFFTVITN